jgi:outer membrane murein-binding lipoprotein Lpp
MKVEDANKILKDMRAVNDGLHKDTLVKPTREQWQAMKETAVRMRHRMDASQLARCKALGILR